MMHKQLPGFSEEVDIGGIHDEVCDYDKTEMLRHCLDRYKVKEAIHKCTHEMPGIGMAINPYDLLMELGLDK